MAKHDQRILKFLNQNADRTPTITEMMTRLNISISDISDSLGSLQAQNLISKKTNNQGIECWFPNSPMSVQQPMPPIQATPQHFATQQLPIQTPMAMDRNPDARAVHESRFTGIPERIMQAPEPQPPTPRPVQARHIPMAEPVFSGASSGGEFSSQPAPQMAGSMPMYGLSQPAKGIGAFTLLMGLAVAVGLSVFLGHRLTTKEIGKVSQNFVDTKALTEATAGFKAFQEKTKIHVTALEADLKKLTAELASSKAAAESLKTVAAVKPAEEPAKSKRKKSLPIAKAKAKAKSSSSSAIAKAAARGAAKKRKASASGYSARETSEYTSSSESSYSDPSPSVPEPPGLEDLPPAPAE